MLSAFAARRSQAPTPVVETPGALSGANSEIEEQLASVQIPLKRKSIPVEESSSTRKRKKSSQKPKATQRVEVNTNGYQPGVLSTPVREYSPSVPVASAQDAVMLDIEPSYVFISTIVSLFISQIGMKSRLSLLSHLF